MAANLAGAQVLSIADAEAAEGSTIDFIVTLSPASTDDATVSFETQGSTATAGTDYTSASGTLTITAGDTSATIAVATTEDTLDELDEEFTVTLSMASSEVTIGDATATGTINDDDEARLTISGGSAVEGDPIKFGVTLSTTSTREVTANWAASGGTAAAEDYTPAAGEVTIMAGSTTATITVQTVDDSTDEAAETFTVGLSSPVNATLGSPSTATGTINDNDPQPSVSIQAASATEGGTIAFPVRLNVSSGRPVTVPWTVAAGTASAGSDYTTSTSSGTVTIMPGVASGTASVDTVEDTLAEGDETFTITLGTPVNATLGNPSAVLGTITDDDGRPSITIADASATEGDSGTTAMSFTLSLSPPSSGRITVDWTTGHDNDTATAGADYTAASGTVEFSPGATSRTVSVDVRGDTLDEADETFTVTLSAATGGASIGDASATGTINDNNDPRPTLSIADASATEGAPVKFTANLSAASGLAVSATWTASDGTATGGGSNDYSPTSGTLEIPAGRTSGTVTVNTRDDDADEAQETFTVALSGVQNATPGDVTATGTIDDNDGSPELAIFAPTANVQEGDSGSRGMVFEVTLSGTSERTVKVNWRVSGGTATAGTDFSGTSGALTFDAGTRSRNVTVQVLGDQVDENDESVTVSLTLPENADVGTMSSASGVIADDDERGVTISKTGVTVAEKDGSATYTVVLTSQPTATVTVTPSVGGTHPGAATVSGRMRFTATNWNTAQVVTVTGADDNFQTGTRSAEVTHSISGGDYADEPVDKVTVSVTDEDVKGVTVSETDVTVAENGGTATYTVVLGTEPRGGSVTVTPSVTGAQQDAAGVSGALVFSTQNWNVARQVTVTGRNDNYDNAGDQRTAFVQHAVTGGDYEGQTADSVTVTVSDDDTQEVIVSKSSVSVSEPNGTATYTVKLGTEPRGGNVTVTPSVGGTHPGAASVTGGPLTFTATTWSTEQTLTVAVSDDDLDNTNDRRTATVDHGIAGGGYDSIQVPSVAVVVADDEPTPRLSISDQQVNETDSNVTLNFPVVMDTKSDRAVTVALALSDITATIDDYHRPTTSIPVTISAGDTEASGAITVRGDTLSEINETFRVTLENPVNAVLSATTTATVTIVDDDELVEVSVGTPHIGFDEANCDASENTLDFPIFTVPVSGQVVTAAWAVAGTSATAGADFAAAGGTVTIPAGASTRHARIPILCDDVFEGVEGIRVTLGDVTGATKNAARTTAVGSIVDDETLSFSIDDASFAEDAASGMVFTVRLNVPSSAPCRQAGKPQPVPAIPQARARTTKPLMTAWCGSVTRAWLKP